MRRIIYRRTQVILRFFLAASLVISVAAVLISCSSRSEKQISVPIVDEGTISLEGWNFTDNGPVYLIGYWEFFWKQYLPPTAFSRTASQSNAETKYVEVPVPWDQFNDGAKPADGYATYRCTVFLPSTLAGTMLYLELPEQSSAYRLFVNGKQLHTVGVLGTGTDPGEAKYLPTVKSVSIDTAELEIIMHISNFQHRSGGFWAPVSLGTGEQLLRKHSLNIALDAFLLGSILIMAIYHIVLFFVRHEEKAMLFFSLFCIAIAVRLSVTGQFFMMQLFPDLSWPVLKKIEFFTETGSIALFAMFLRRLFPVEFHRHVERFFQISCGLYCFLSIVLPVKILIDTALVTTILTALLGVYSIYLIVTLTIRKREGSLIFLAGILFLVFGVTYDIISAQLHAHTFYLFPTMLVCFFITQSILLSRRFAKAFSKAERQLENFLLTLASAIESKDKYTGGHVERVANYARDVTRFLNISPEETRRIYLGAIIHDIGKLSIPDSILNKSAKLTKEEFEKIKQHTTRGKQLLRKIEDIETAANIALYHQERWDGKGYPTGISGFDIPLPARITALADYWDAITTDRPYRIAMPIEKALDIMYQEKGRAFDPKLFEIFMNGNVFVRYLNQRQREEYQILVKESRVAPRKISGS